VHPKRCRPCAPSLRASHGGLLSCLHQPHAQSIVQEVCAALGGTLLAQAVSKLILSDWEVEAPMAALHASFPDVLRFELFNCPSSMATSLSEAIAVWPMLQSISRIEFVDVHEAAQQQLEAAARIAAELKAGQPFEIVLCVFEENEGDAGRLDALVAAIRSAGGGGVAVHWMFYN